MDAVIQVLKWYAPKEDIKQIVKTLDLASGIREESFRDTEYQIGLVEAVRKACVISKLNVKWVSILANMLHFHWNEVQDLISEYPA